MTDNEIKREKTFEEELPYFKERLKEVFDNYHNPNGYEDRLEICVLRDAYRIVGKAEEEIACQQAEIERLQKHNFIAAHKHYNDGIKAFAERLKETAVEAQLGDYYYKITTVQGIDYILKEMVGDDK